MGGLTTRQTAATVLVAAMAVLAGCGGGGEATPTSTPGPDYRDPLSYSFSEGEMYSYEIAQNGNVTSRLSVQVAAVNDTHIAMNVLVESPDGEEVPGRIVTKREKILPALGNNSLTGYLRFANFLNAITVMDGYDGNSGEELDASNMDSSEMSWNRAAIRVGNETTIEGETCRQVSINPEVSSDAPDIAACIKPNWPFALAYRLESRDGSTAIRLHSFNRSSAS